MPPAPANQEPDGPIDEVKDVADVKKEPLALPKGYEWCTPDITIDEQVSWQWNRRTLTRDRDRR